MDDAGQKLKKRREELNLRYRDVEVASQSIAARRGSDEFLIALSRLSDIENKGTVPSIYRLYSLCAIYRLDINDVLEWYGVDASHLASDASSIGIARTHSIGLKASGNGSVQIPLSLDPGVDLKSTFYLTRMIQRWGKIPLMLLNGLELRDHRYAYVGTEDWSMYPLIQPGSLVIIDETKRKVVTRGWTNEFERPIYFLEYRGGYRIGWCNLKEDSLVVLPHPASDGDTYVYLPDEIDIIGQITGVAMRLDQARRHRTHS